MQKITAICQATASILWPRIEGKYTDALEGLQPQDMLSMLKVPLTASRQRCGLLSFKVLKTMLYSRDDEAHSSPAAPRK